MLASFLIIAGIKESPHFELGISTRRGGWKMEIRIIIKIDQIERREGWFHEARIQKPLHGSGGGRI